MKDAASCDKPRGAANWLRSGDFRMGKPNESHVSLLHDEFIVMQSQLREVNHLSTGRKIKQ